MGVTQPPQPAPGSDFYYAILYVPTARREQLAVINALKNELCAIPLTVSDPGIARIKLEWWRAEAERLLQGQARHPLTQSYSQTNRAIGGLHDALCALVRGLDDELGGRHLATRDDQHAWFDSTFGPYYALCMAVSAGNETLPPGQWQTLGRWIEIGTSLLDLKPLATRRLRRLATAELIAAGCTWDDMESGCHDTAVVEMLDRQTRFTIENITNILHAAPRDIQRRQRPVFTLARIVRQTLVEMRNDGYRVWQHRIELTPLRKLWLAWRTRFA